MTTVHSLDQIVPSQSCRLSPSSLCTGFRDASLAHYTIIMGRLLGRVAAARTAEIRTQLDVSSRSVYLIRARS